MNKLQIAKQPIAGKSNPLKPAESTQVNFDPHTIDCEKLQDIMQKNTGLSYVCPWYSSKQLRRIHRIQVKRYKYGHGNIRRSPNMVVVLSGYMQDGTASIM